MRTAPLPILALALGGLVYGAGLGLNGLEAGATRAVAAPPRPASAREAAPARDAPPARSVAPRARRSASEADDPTPASPRTAERGALSIPSFEVGGVVVDARGLRLAAVSVALERADREVRTNGRGEFRLAVPAVRAPFEARDARWATIGSTVVTHANRAEPHLVVVAERGSVTGRVVDTAGRPAVGLAIDVRADLRAATAALDDPRRDALVARSHRATSDARGRFGLTELPRGVPLDLVVRRGSRVLDERVVRASGAALEIVLGDGRERLVTGRVLDRDERAVAGARVRQGSAAARSDALGRFELELDADSAPLLYASAREGSARLDLTGRPSRHGVTLRLTTPPDRLAGELVTSIGQPAVGWSVSVLDASGPSSGPRASEPADALHGPQRETLSTRTAADGAFELEGWIARREVELMLFDKRTGASIVTAPVRVGRLDLRLVVPDASERRRFAGAVTDRTGRPLPGASVRFEPWLEAGSVRWPERRGATAVTDAEGRFELELHEGPGRLRVARPRFAPLAVEVGTRTSTAVRLTLERLCELEVVLESGTCVLGAVDARGRRLPVLPSTLDERGALEARCAAGATRLWVPASCVALTRVDGGPAGREPLTPSATEVTRVRVAP